jgi:hypothetical protein
MIVIIVVASTDTPVAMASHMWKLMELAASVTLPDLLIQNPQTSVNATSNVEITDIMT